MQETISVSPEVHVDLYKGFTNVITGESFRCISNSKEACIFEWIVQPQGYVPLEHIHLNQDEIFHIREGELKIVIEGKEVIAKPGDIVKVKKGQRHIAFNNKPWMLNCVVSFEPALDTFKFFQCFGGLTIDGDTDRFGKINIPKMLYFSRRMNAQSLARPTSVPAPFFRLSLSFFYWIGTLLGWEKFFLKYTQGEVIDRRTIL